jgi:hypothetical protein
MVMSGHENEGLDLPSGPLADFPQATQVPFPVLIVLVYVLSVVPAAQYVIYRASKFDARFSSPVRSLYFEGRKGNKIPKFLD